MPHARHGQPAESNGVARRHRVDSSSPNAQTPSTDEKSGAAAGLNPESGGYSGRWFVVSIVIGVLLLWAALYLSFREWKSRYRIRADYGLARVVPIVDSLNELAPPGVAPAAWRDAVERTRDLVKTVVSSNLLDLAEMDRLREELAEAVARSRAAPSSAVDELASIWNRLSDRADFLLRDSRSKEGVRHARPEILPPRPLKSATHSSPSGLTGGSSSATWVTCTAAPPHFSRSA